MGTASNARKNRTLLSALAYPGDGKAPAAREMIRWLAYAANHQLLTVD